MADLKPLAESMRKWADSAKRAGDDYDEDGQPERAQFLWGEAEAYGYCARMVELEIASEASDV